MNACSGMRDEPEPTETRLALQPTGDVVGQGHDLQGRAEDELPRVQDERLVAVRLDQVVSSSCWIEGSMCV